MTITIKVIRRYKTNGTSTEGLSPGQSHFSANHSEFCSSPEVTCKNDIQDYLSRKNAVTKMSTENDKVVDAARFTSIHGCHTMP